MIVSMQTGRDPNYSEAHVDLSEIAVIEYHDTETPSCTATLKSGATFSVTGGTADSFYRAYVKLSGPEVQHLP